MAYIRIQFDSIISGTHRLDSARANITDVRNSIISVTASLEPRVRSRSSINTRINSITNNLADINNRLNAIKRVSIDSANKYKQTEEKIKKNAKNLKHTGTLN